MKMTLWRPSPSSGIPALAIAIVLLSSCSHPASPEPDSTTGPWDPGRAPLLYTATVEKNNDLYLMEDGRVRRLTQDGASDNYAAFSPNGRFIAFQSQRDGSYDVFRIGADGSDPVNLTHHPKHDGLPVWSPDGSRLAFFSSRGLDYPEPGPIPGHIWIMNADGSNPRQVTAEPMTSTLGPSDWSPDGKSLLLSRKGETGTNVWQLDLESGKEKRLTDDADSEGGARFSPDGRRVAFYMESEQRSDLVVMDLDGRRRQVVTSGEGRYYLYAWSPDGKWLSASWLSDDEQTFEARAVRIEDGKTMILKADQQAREASWRRPPARD